MGLEFSPLEGCGWSADLKPVWACRCGRWVWGRGRALSPCISSSCRYAATGVLCRQSPVAEGGRDNWKNCFLAKLSTKLNCAKVYIKKKNNASHNLKNVRISVSETKCLSLYFLMQNIAVIQVYSNCKNLHHYERIHTCFLKRSACGASTGSISLIYCMTSSTVHRLGSWPLGLGLSRKLPGRAKKENAKATNSNLWRQSFHLPTLLCYSNFFAMIH